VFHDEERTRQGYPCLVLLSLRPSNRVTVSDSAEQLLKTITNKMLAEDSGKGFNLDEIVLNYEIINRTPH
jgi:hypothetical protein